MEFKNEVFLLVYERGKSLESITRKEEGTIIDVRIRGSPNFVLQIPWTSVFVCGSRTSLSNEKLINALKTKKKSAWTEIPRFGQEVFNQFQIPVHFLLQPISYLIAINL